MQRSKVRSAYLLVLLVFLLSLLNSQPAGALSLPLVNDLLDTLLPLHKSRSSENGPVQQPATPVSPTNTEPVSEINITPQNTVSSSSETVQTTDVTLPGALPQLATAAPIVESVRNDEINAAARDTDHDVLAKRMQNAAIAARETRATPSELCSKFFGQCWYMAAPIISVVIIIGYIVYQYLHKIHDNTLL